MFWCSNLFVPYRQTHHFNRFFFKLVLPISFLIQHLRCWNFSEKNEPNTQIGISSHSCFLISIGPLMLSCDPSICAPFIPSSFPFSPLVDGGLFQNNTFGLLWEVINISKGEVGSSVGGPFWSLPYYPVRTDISRGLSRLRNNRQNGFSSLP